MPAIPSGELSLHLVNLETLLSESSSFQTWTVSANATEAKEHIGIVEEAAGYDRPFALISFNEGGWNTEDIGGGADISYGAPKVDMEIRFEADAVGDDPKDEIIVFYNNIGAIVKDMQALSGVDDKIVVKRFFLSQNARRIRPKVGERRSGSDENYIQTVIGCNVSPY